MHVLLTSEARMQRTSDQTVWAPAAYGNSMWRRYLDVFSAANVIARVQNVQEPAPGFVRANSADVRFFALPFYEGLGGFLRAARQISNIVDDALDDSDAVILRSPSPIATQLYQRCRARRRTFGVEVIGDPGEIFQHGAIHHPLRPLMRHVAMRTQRWMCGEAIAALYVTAETLQRRYPCDGVVFGVSDVHLPKAAFREPTGVRSDAPFNLVTVASLAQPYKGIDVLLHAVAQLCARHDVRLCVVGEGQLRRPLASLAHQLGVAHVVRFAGQQDAAGVRAALDAADLFVLPSRAEGMPRALIEAMARGLAAVASNVGGVREVLAVDALVVPGDVSSLIDRLETFLTSSALRLEHAQRNFTMAHAIAADSSREKRRHFHRTVAASIPARDAVRRPQAVHSRASESDV